METAAVTGPRVAAPRGLGANRAMSVFRPLSLGTPIPGSLHSVSCSLPTMADVIGYEERDARVLEAMRAGYPRFAVHPLVQELTRTLAAEVEYWPTPDPQLATGSREQIMDVYRQVRDGLARRIKDRLDWKPQGSL